LAVGVLLASSVGACRHAATQAATRVLVVPVVVLGAATLLMVPNYAVGSIPFRAFSGLLLVEAVLVGMAWGPCLEGGRGGVVRLLAFIALGVVFGLKALGLHATVGGIPKEPWRDVARLIAARAVPGEPVVAFRQGGWFVLKHYLHRIDGRDRLPLVTLPMQPEPEAYLLDFREMYRDLTSADFARLSKLIDSHRPRTFWVALTSSGLRPRLKPLEQRYGCPEEWRFASYLGVLRFSASPSPRQSP
jgi:hypothetical protein